MKEWIDIKKERIPVDIPCEVKQDNGRISLGCWHQTQYSSGIIKLACDGDTCTWNGKSWLIKVTHWRPF